MRYRYIYKYKTGLTRVKTKLAIAFTALALGAGGIIGSVAIFGSAHADTSAINFEPPTYQIGNINGQNGWSKTGAYDAAVVSNSSGYASFGTQSLRISNAVTSGSFGDQTFAPALSQQAGEPGAWDKNDAPVTSPQPHFESQFDIASTTKAMQSGLAISVSPDNGVGGRMSYLRFEDHQDGIEVFFDDVEGTSDPANFIETQVATLSYTQPHTVKFSMDFVPGPSNDIVKVYIDGNLVISGTSWENYYRFDHESNPGLVNVSRTVDTMLFRAGGAAASGTNGHGYLFDNLSMESGPTVNVPTNKNDCKHGGWKDYTNANGKPFKNQGQCVAYFNHGKHGSKTKIKNTNNINITNSNHQTASSGNAKVKNNTKGGSATSGNATNNNKTKTKVIVSNF